MKSAATEKNKASNIRVVSDKECLRELVALGATAGCEATDFLVATRFTVAFFVDIYSA